MLKNIENVNCVIIFYQMIFLGRNGLQIFTDYYCVNYYGLLLKYKIIDIFIISYYAIKYKFVLEFSILLAYFKQRIRRRANLFLVFRRNIVMKKNSIQRDLDEPFLRFLTRS